VRPSLIISEVGIGLRRNLTMTVAMLVTMSLSLALVGSGLLINKQVGTMKDFWYDRVEVSVYLCGEASTGGACGGTAVTEPQRQALLGDLEALPQVEQVFYESQEDAYDRFREQFADSPDLVENVTADALPESFRVKLVDPEQFEVVASSFQGRPGVEQVQDQKALLEPFFNVLDKLRDYALILAGVELIAAVLLVINTIVISANGRRRETGIMRLVGASTFSIQVPFLIEGVLAGFFGALFASGALAALKAFVIDGSLRQTFEFTAFVGWDDVLSVMPLLFLGGVVVAGVTSFFTLLFFTRV
jgi:cell division transport system permease protein